MDTGVRQALEIVLRRLQEGERITIRREHNPVLDHDTYSVCTPPGPPWPQVWVAIPRTPWWRSRGWW